MQKFLLKSFLSFSFFTFFVNSQIYTKNLLGLGSGPAEEIANKTYIQEQSDLQRKIFKNYDRKMRPILNQSQPIVILFHIYLLYFSIDQLQQVITLNGNMYMTWFDENAIWDPVQYNNIRMTMVKQWGIVGHKEHPGIASHGKELWNPDLKVLNSVSGINYNFEISKHSHASLTSITPNKTKVEVYPTYSIRLRCDFDYTDFPSDIQICVLRLFTVNYVGRVEFRNFNNLQPSVMLGWGNQSEKRHISDWELLSTYTNISNDLQWKPHISVWIVLRRNATHFWVALGLPALVATVINLFSFMTRPEHSIVLIIANFIIQGIFTRDAINELPPATGNVPRIVRYATSLLILTAMVLCAHLCSNKMTKKNSWILRPETIVTRARPILRYLAIGAKGEQVDESSDEELNTKDANVTQNSTQYSMNFIVFRNLCMLLYVFVILTLLFVIFVF